MFSIYHNVTIQKGIWNRNTKIGFDQKWFLKNPNFVDDKMHRIGPLLGVGIVASLLLDSKSFFFVAHLSQRPFLALVNYLPTTIFCISSPLSLWLLQNGCSHHSIGSVRGESAWQRPGWCLAEWPKEKARTTGSIHQQKSPERIWATTRMASGCSKHSKETYMQDERMWHVISKWPFVVHSRALSFWHQTLGMHLDRLQLLIG